MGIFLICRGLYLILRHKHWMQQDQRVAEITQNYTSSPKADHTLRGRCHWLKLKEDFFERNVLQVENSWYWRNLPQRPLVWGNGRIGRYTGIPQIVIRLQTGAGICAVLTGEGVGLEKSINKLDSANIRTSRRGTPVTLAYDDVVELTMTF